MKIKETKKKIIEGLEGKKIVPIQVRFKSRWKLFLIGWRHTRKFPDYSLRKELKNLFIHPKLEVMIK